METAPRSTLNSVLIGAIFVLALGLRLSHLGALPLTDLEATEALWAAEGTPQDSPYWPRDLPPGSSAAYRAATWALFQTVGGNEATARLFPALVGALIVFPPWLLRRRLGPLTALLAALLLAFSPTLVATSRQADGTSSAIFAIALAASVILLGLDGDWSAKRVGTWIAVCLALGLASGSAFFLGLTGLVPAIALMGLTTGHPWPGESWVALRAVLPRAAALGVLGAVLLAVAGGGMTAPAEGLRLWASGWIGPGTMHALSPVVILILYEPLALVFGILGAAAAIRERDSLAIGLAWWVVVSMFVAVLYPGRSGPAVAWSAVPLAFLAARGLAREGIRFRDLPAPWHAVGVAALVVVLFLYAGVQMSAYASGIGLGISPLVPETRLGVAAGAFIVAGLAVLLIGLGWSWDLARSGAAVAAALLLSFVTLSAGWRLNYFRERLGAGEFWTSTAPTYGLPRLTATLASISGATRGVVTDLPVVVDDPVPPPSLVWAVRAFPAFSASELDPLESPPVILMRRPTAEPQLGADYIGQTVGIRETWDFRGPLPPDFLRWWWHRDLPANEDPWLLLVRADVATLGEAGVGETVP